MFSPHICTTFYLIFVVRLKGPLLGIFTSVLYFTLLTILFSNLIDLFTLLFMLQF
jgi:hypothetical protein